MNVRFFVFSLLQFSLRAFHTPVGKMLTVNFGGHDLEFHKNFQKHCCQLTKTYSNATLRDFYDQKEDYLFNIRAVIYN